MVPERSIGRVPDSHPSTLALPALPAPRTPGELRPHLLRAADVVAGVAHGLPRVRGREHRGHGRSRGLGDVHERDERRIPAKCLVLSRLDAIELALALPRPTVELVCDRPDVGELQFPRCVERHWTRHGFARWPPRTRSAAPWA